MAGKSTIRAELESTESSSEESDSVGNHTLNGVLGEWLFRIGTNDFSQLCGEIPEVLRFKDYGQTEERIRI